MARIENTNVYVFDAVPEPSSWLVGTDQGDGKITKSYRIDTIFGLLPGYGYFTDAPADGQPYLRQDNDWVLVPPSGVGSVFSVFGRTGAVTGQVGDYSAFYSQIGHTHTEADITDLKAYLLPSDIGFTVQGWSAALDAVSGTNTGDQTSISGITGTKAQFDLAVTDGNFMYIGDAPTSHTHTEADITDLQAYLLDAPSDGSTYGRLNGAWAVVPTSVTSVFGRTGAVTALAGDYSSFYSQLGHTHVKADITDFSVDIADINAAGVAGVSTYLRGDGSWAGTVTTFSGLTDTLVTTVADGELIRWNGTQWVNNTLSEAGVVSIANPESITGAKTFTNFTTFSGDVNLDASTNLKAEDSPTTNNFTLNGDLGGFAVIFVDYNGDGGGFSNLKLGQTDITYNGSSLMPSGAPVASVFGRTGAVAAEVGDYSAFYLGISAKAADSNALDGLDSSQFVRSDQNDTKTGYLFLDDQVLNNFALRVESNNANYSGFYVDGSHNVQLYLRDSTGVASIFTPSPTGVTLNNDFTLDTADLNLDASLTTDDAIINDINWNNNGLAAADKRTAIIRAKTSTGAATAKGGKFQFITRVPDSTSFTFPLTIAHDSFTFSTGGVISGDMEFNGTAADFTGAMRWMVSAADTAHQRCDSRDDATTFSRLHWFGVSDTGATSNFRHAWFDGSGYLNVTADGGAVEFGSVVKATRFHTTLKGDQQQILKFDTDRAWAFYQDGTGAGTRLALRDLAGGKSFIIQNNSGTDMITLNAGNGDVTANNFILSSDERLKRNIEELEDSPINVNWKQFNMGNDTQKRYGVIAQELEVYHPEFVYTKDDGMKSVAYVDLLVAKMAEKDRQIEDLGSRIITLELIIKDLI